MGLAKWLVGKGGDCLKVLTSINKWPKRMTGEHPSKNWDLEQHNFHAFTYFPPPSTSTAVYVTGRGEGAGDIMMTCPCA